MRACGLRGQLRRLTFRRVENPVVDFGAERAVLVHVEHLTVRFAVLRYKQVAVGIHIEGFVVIAADPEEKSLPARSHVVHGNSLVY